MTKCFEVFVILGLDPRIHKETSKMLVVRWIAGSSPAMTRKNKVPGKDKGKGTTIEKRIFINHSEQHAAQEKEKSNA